MSIASRKGNSLPSLQKRIIIHLGENGPKTRNEIAKAVGSTYKSVLFSFRSLSKKGLIREVGSKFYRQQSFSVFWLTQRGFVAALSNYADSQKVKANALRLCKTKEDQEDLQIWFSMIDRVGVEKSLQLIDVVEGKLELKNLPLTVEQADALICLAQDNPKLLKLMKTKAKPIISKLSKFLEGNEKEK